MNYVRFLEGNNWKVQLYLRFKRNNLFKLKIYNLRKLIYILLCLSNQKKAILHCISLFCNWAKMQRELTALKFCLEKNVLRFSTSLETKKRPKFLRPKTRQFFKIFFKSHIFCALTVPFLHSLSTFNLPKMIISLHILSYFKRFKVITYQSGCRLRVTNNNNPL